MHTHFALPLIIDHLLRCRSASSALSFTVMMGDP